MLGLKNLRNSINTSLSTWHWWVIAIITFAVSQYIMGWLTNLYNLTEFPVSFFVGQTTFDAAELKGYWQVLIEKNTLGKYVMVQVYDYGYMLTVLIAFACCCIALFRSFPINSRLRNLAWLFVLFTPQAATFDALENAVSFIMLMQPLEFADWLVHPYSAFASIKFVIYGIAYLWFIIGSILALGVNVVRYFQTKNQNSVHTVEL
ncbi:hypothetical protein QX776_00070 [Alteromonadaceae bacterium BrNp21-10]|nr:hypothetical protein [Alteromonadaceae bacterium BrNp21-10]